MKKAVALTLAMFAMSASGLAQADTNFRLKAGYAVGGDYEIESDTGQKWEADFNPVALSGTFIFDGGYADVTFASSSSDSLTFSFAPTGFSGVTGSLDRTDIAVTVGTTGSLSVFGGYKKGKSEFNNSIATVFENQGVFIGLAPSFEVVDNARVGFSGALAFMDGTWTDTSGTADADFTFGYSLGSAFSYQFTDNLSAGVDLKYQAYSFDFKTTLGKTVDENILLYGVNIAYRF